MISVERPRCGVENGQFMVSSRIHVKNDRSYDIYYRSSQGPVSSGDETFFAATLIPAMQEGGPLHLDGSVSKRLFRGAARIQEIYRVWDPGLHGVRTDVRTGGGLGNGAARGVGCFFSGGVDSFYTFLKHREEITHLVFVHGFDLKLADTALRAEAACAIRGISREFGKQLIEVDTNLRDFSERFAHWGTHYHGSALASVALLLAPQLGKIYIPASNTYLHLHPRGSHPLVDPRWSTEGMEIDHDGCEATRFGKIERIIGSEIVLKTLRVCWENLGGTYNCGRCEKCVRTMIPLSMLGVLNRCTTFRSRFSIAKLRKLDMSEGTVKYVKEDLEAARRLGIKSVLTRCLALWLGFYYARRGGLALWRAMKQVLKWGLRSLHLWRPEVKSHVPTH
ncbi:MAG: hypothetical protein HYY14_01805 [Candidatus Omnitrophica bacterium]|nr:hypothetical protein [Candidatus Omnitrophota bacterium]